MATQNVFGNTSPSAVDVSTDADQITLGHVFKVATAGKINGLRYFETNSGNVNPAKPKTGALWTISGTLLGTMTFPTPNPANAHTWVDGSFSSPIAIAADTPYIFGVYVDTSNWSANFGGLNTDVVSGDITLYGYLNDPASIGQGRYFEGSLAFPSNASGGHSSYGVDLTFEASSSAPVEITGTSAMTFGVSGAITRSVRISGSSSVSFEAVGNILRSVRIAGQSALAFVFNGLRPTVPATNFDLIEGQGVTVEFEDRGVTVPYENRGITR